MEIRAVRKVIKQLPVEILPSVLECKQLYAEGQSWSTTSDVSISHLVLNGPMQFFWCFAI
jgi:hypothetical protein